MSDRRLRELERQASSGAPDAIVRWAHGLVRIGETAKPRALLHPLVKKNPGARPLFLQVLPASSCAFCAMCGRAFTLNDKGIPLSDKPNAQGRLPKKRRATPKKRHCYKCSERRSKVARAQARRSRFATTPRLQMPRECYCTRCGILLENSAHRCDTTLPEWLSGGDDVEPIKKGLDRSAPHWSDWRSL